MYIQTEMTLETKTISYPMFKGIGYNSKSPVKFKKMTDIEFLDLARNLEKCKGKKYKGQFIRPVLAVNHTRWAADGFRLHIVNDAKECQCYFCKKHETPDYNQLIPRNFIGEIAINRDAILDACNVSKIFSREGSNVVRIDIADVYIEIAGVSEEFGRGSVFYQNNTVVNKNYKSKTYQYSKTGSDIFICFNVDFLIDAVKSMGENINIKYAGTTRPVLITDGKRTAILMPMKLG